MTDLSKGKGPAVVPPVFQHIPLWSLQCPSASHCGLLSSPAHPAVVPPPCVPAHPAVVSPASRCIPLWSLQCPSASRCALPSIPEHPAVVSSVSWRILLWSLQCPSTSCRGLPSVPVHPAVVLPSGCRTEFDDMMLGMRPPMTQSVRQGSLHM